LRFQGQKSRSWLLGFNRWGRDSRGILGGGRQFTGPRGAGPCWNPWGAQFFCGFGGAGQGGRFVYLDAGFPRAGKGILGNKRGLGFWPGPGELLRRAPRPTNPLPAPMAGPGWGRLQGRLFFGVGADSPGGIPGGGVWERSFSQRKNRFWLWEAGLLFQKGALKAACPGEIRLGIFR